MNWPALTAVAIGYVILSLIVGSWIGRRFKKQEG